MRHTIDGDLPFLHRLEQCRLGLGRGTVYLIRQEEIGEYRTWAKLERARRFLIDAHAGHVGWHEVGRELNTSEAHIQCAGEYSNKQCFRRAGNAFEQNVSPGNECGEDLIDYVFLAKDTGCDGIANALERGGCSGEISHSRNALSMFATAAPTAARWSDEFGESGTRAVAMRSISRDVAGSRSRSADR